MTAVMIVPVWPGATFFGVFWPDGRHAAEFVTKMLLFKPYYVCGPLVTTRALRGRTSFDTAALKVDFSSKSSVFSRVNKRFCLLGGCMKCV